MSKKNGKGKGVDVDGSERVKVRQDFVEFVDKFPEGTEVSARKDDGSIVIGEIMGEPVDDEYSNLVVRILDEKGDSFRIGIDRIRPRQIERKKSIQKLRVSLTDAEKMEAGRQLADLQARGEELTADMKSAVKRMKVDIDSVTAQMMSRGELLRTGYELRSVDCELAYDYDRGTVTEIRLDTGEVVSTRGLYPSEQEQKLPGEVGAAASEDRGAQSQEPSAPLETSPITDEEIAKAVEIIKELQRASVAGVQRRMKIGYNRACQIMERLEFDGVVGPAKGDEPREILIPMDGEAGE